MVSVFVAAFVEQNSRYQYLALLIAADTCIIRNFAEVVVVEMKCA